jgi:hypothetical protein
LHHIIVSGIERRRIFIDDQDRDNFVKRLGAIVTETQTFCFAWSAVKAIRRAQDHMKSDERILGDGEFTQSVLDEAKERLELFKNQKIIILWASPILLLRYAKNRIAF